MVNGRSVDINGPFGGVNERLVDINARRVDVANSLCAVRALSVGVNGPSVELRA